ncbi:hypothetical protein GCM10023086_22020 [Streptomyces venetus]|uniref:Secreted protein n=1 Tax=Streptomyces venetus TaxID=1701086 RepID=A0ABP8FJ31_9ACTN
MCSRMLRSVLVAAFSVAAALGALGGFSDAKDEVRANSVWPSVAVSAESGGGESASSPGAEEIGS